MSGGASFEYFSMGAPDIRSIDPASRRGWSITREGHFEALDGVLRTIDGRAGMKIADLFLPGE